MRQPKNSGNMKDLPKDFAERLVKLNNNTEELEAKTLSEVYGTERTKHMANLEKDGAIRTSKNKLLTFR